MNISFISTALNTLGLVAALWIGSSTALAQTPPTLHESEGQVVALDAKSVKLAHGPFKTLDMPGMTMRFPLAKPEVGQGLTAGDRVHIWLRDGDDGYVVERLKKLGD